MRVNVLSTLAAELLTAEWSGVAVRQFANI